MTETTAPLSLPPLSIKAWLRWDVVRRQLAKLTPHEVLELGCGQGSMGARIAVGRSYVGVEPDKSSCVVAAQRIGAIGGTVLHGTHDRVSPGSTYDMVCAFEVLEHIEDDESALTDWAKFIRTGGFLMLSVLHFNACSVRWTLMPVTSGDTSRMIYAGSSKAQD